MVRRINHFFRSPQKKLHNWHAIWIIISTSHMESFHYRSSLIDKHLEDDEGIITKKSSPNKENTNKNVFNYSPAINTFLLWPRSSRIKYKHPLHTHRPYLSLSGLQRYDKLASEVLVVFNLTNILFINS